MGIYPQEGSPEAVPDLAGNVWEWCLNEYEPPQNTQLAGHKYRVVRGGSWGRNRWACRAAYRYGDLPGYRYGSIGFRVCCSAPSKAARCAADRWTLAL